ncbi:hypothetical protein AAE478_004248 [Parahypoxylon ruwenzoriense]
MVDVDIDAFLQQGYWPNSRARSPDTRLFNSGASSPRSSHVDVTAPRRLPYNIRRLRDYPPPPSVEDETESLAKEYGSVVSAVLDEEPIHRGDVEQYPILVLVHEHNPERRFVLVSTLSDSKSPTSSEGSAGSTGSTSSTDDSSSNTKKLPERPKPKGPRPEPEPTYYEANTGRKFQARAHREDDSERMRDTRPDREKYDTKRENLPAIVTDVGSELRPNDTRKAKPTARPNKADGEYISPSLSSRPQEGKTVSPDVIEHASRGRDRAYYRGGSSPSTQDHNQSAHPNAQYSKNPHDDRRLKERNPNSAKSASPTHHKRHSTADLPQQVRGTSAIEYERRGRYAEPPSPKADRTGYVRLERDTSSQISTSPIRGRDTPPSSDYFNSSDEEVARRVQSQRRQKLVVHDDGKAYQGFPAESRSNDRHRPRGPSPLPTPRTSQNQVYERDSISSSPRSSSTIPKDMKFPRSEQRSQASFSRTSTGRSAPIATAPVAIPTAAATVATATINSSSPTDPRRSGILPPPPPPRADSIRLEPRSSASILSSSPQRQSRQPLGPDSPRDVVTTDQSTALYRRYLDEVQAGGLPSMHRCPRRKPAIGHVDWLTLPRCDNFNICPSCYEAAFSNTEYAHHFVPAPFRSADRPLACDFGTSRYYHIAYFFTQKYGKADLILFRNIANVAAKSQPCTGARETARIWYSVKDPRSAYALENFNVCYSCAKTVEVLLPNLMGLFVPMDSPAEPTIGVCSMHQQNERRFSFYFDLLEAASDQALITKSTPDVQGLADKIRDLAEVPECARDRPVHSSRWYTMRSIPEFTVCEECFGEVVWPMIKRDSGSVAATFHKYPQALPLAACQLYSARMRDVFEKAVRHGDLQYLEDKVVERRVKEQEFHTRIVGLDRQVLGAAWVDAEVNQALREWQRWE